MKFKLIFLSSIALLFSFSLNAQDKKLPSFEEVLSLPGIGTPFISPDGNHVIFSKNRTDWKENRYDSEIWISQNGQAPFQLTNTAKGSSSGYIWSPDSKWILFRASRDGSSQLYAIRPNGGEAIKISQVDGNIGQFDFSPDGKKIAFTMTPKSSKEDKERKEKFGAFEVDDGEYKLAGLFQIDFDPHRPSPSDLPCYEKTDSLKAINCIEWPKPEELLKSDEFTVAGFSWSPDGKKIAYDKQPDPLINSWFYGDIAILDLDSRESEDFVTNPSGDGLVDWSPDGQYLLYFSNVDNFESAYYTNNRLFKKSISDGTVTELATDFDEDKRVLEWNKEGIFFTAWNKTARKLYQLNPDNDHISVTLDFPERIGGVTFSKDAQQIAFSASGTQQISEVYRTTLNNKLLQPITKNNELIKDWKLSNSEIIDWKSKDGATIEGVLHKPANYDPNKKYPLLVIIHGGPTGISTTKPLASYVYPILQWLDKGALILEPNYRGSAGYGADFRKLNVKNLGVGDAWDVLSGVDHLEAQGLIDTARMGCMGWSQGGYISAFLSTTSNRFKAISVGAGISNWMTYYVNTDIHPFTRQYLKATPWSDQEIYEKTSPMTYINQASTPTLIQHGEFDRRVPIANAYELAQGLRDVGITTKLIVYKGFGHGISKPKERLAAVTHNWEWFNKYIWNN